jgi:hypothetical protein
MFHQFKNWAIEADSLNVTKQAFVRSIGRGQEGVKPPFYTSKLPGYLIESLVRGVRKTVL